MSHSYQNTERYLQEALHKEQELLAQLYSPQSCRTRHQLQQLMDNELGALIDIKMQIRKMSKEAVLEGMKLDGEKYPPILWAEEIAPRIPDFTLRSLYQQAPVGADFTEPVKVGSKKNASVNRNVIYAVTATGIILTIRGLTLTPMNYLLLTMGIVLTATGLVLLVKEVYFDKKSLDERKPSAVPGANAHAESTQIADLLKTILTQNCEVIRKWNLELYSLAVDTMDKIEVKKEV